MYIYLLYHEKPGNFFTVVEYLKVGNTQNTQLYNDCDKNLPQITDPSCYNLESLVDIQSTRFRSH